MRIGESGWVKTKQTKAEQNNINIEEAGSKRRRVGEAPGMLIGRASAQPRPGGKVKR